MGLSERIIRPRRGLPDSRPVVGGLLVGLAAVGTWWISVGAGSPTPPSYVVATRGIDPGHRIVAADLGLSAMDLSAPARKEAFTDADGVIGMVAVGPVHPGGLLQAAGLVPSTGTRTARELSFAVEAQWAVGGVIRPGDRVDVFATDDRTGPAQTRLVLRHALVRRAVASGDTGLGGQPGQTLTVVVDDPQAIVEAVTAVRASKVTVVRATGALPSEVVATAPTSSTTTTLVRRAKPKAAPLPKAGS